MITYINRTALTAVMAAWILTAHASAQSPAPPAATPSKIFTRNKSFCLPIALDANERAKVQNVQLYVRNGPNDPWMLKYTVPPTRTEFDYSVPQDGEYGFTIVTLKQNDKLSRADLARMVPGLIVVVDSQPPDIALRTLPPTAQGLAVECKVRDANPDPTRLKMEFQTADRTWQVLTPSPQDASIFPLPGTVAKDSIVRATATDRAGNSTMRVLSIDGAVTQAPMPRLKDSMAVSDVLESRAEKISPAVSEQVRTAPPPLAEPIKQPTPFVAEPPAAASGRQLINSTHVTLEYQIEQQGPTGVSKVEVWMTRDDGQTWQRLCDDPDHQSPVEFDLPGDGQYGVSLVATNGSGFGAKPPARGDAPDYLLEVDTTKPVAQLLSAKPSAGDAGAVLLITWVAHDLNLGETPVDLYYALRSSGPWLPLAKGIKNDGNHLCHLPPDVGPEFYVRMEVTDRAGNMERCDWPEPIRIDTAKPKARVVRVRARTRN